jgi:hypothetical protein
MIKGGSLKPAPPPFFSLRPGGDELDHFFYRKNVLVRAEVLQAVAFHAARVPNALLATAAAAVREEALGLRDLVKEGTGLSFRLK